MEPLNVAESHIPVMLPEVIASLAPRAGEVFVDGTFGCGGYSKGILDYTQCRVIGIDRDPDAIARGRFLETHYSGRFRILEGTFSQMRALLAQEGLSRVDGIVLDLGVSSPQLDQASRGFSFREDGPLDMRMSQNGTSAADVIASISEEELANILYVYGEERRSRAIARAIVRKRHELPIERTAQLAEIVRSVLGRGDGTLDPATRTFMALRIYVNSELDELGSALREAESLLVPGGRLVVVTFHSLEDRLVKTFLQEGAGKTKGRSRYVPEVRAKAPAWQLLTKKPIVVSEEEACLNPRARSAKLRAAVKVTSQEMVEGEP